jgi:ABC-type transport system involved in multi-copper enzyme maturation permease subunit
MFALILNDWLAIGAVTVLALIALGVVAWLLIGLFQARSLIRREFMAYFLSPIAYVVLVVFLFVMGCLFFQTMQQLTADGAKGVEFPMQLMLSNKAFWWVFVFIPPLLTMRVFAEERSSGTLEVLMTSPLPEWQIVLSKYIACFAFYVVLWLPTLVYLPVLCDLRWPEFHDSWSAWSITFLAGLGCMLIGVPLALVPAGTRVRLVSAVLLLVGLIAACLGGWAHFRGFSLPLGFTTLDVQPADPPLMTITAGIDPWPVVAAYLGLALAGAMFLALGLLISSLVRSQMVAALVSLVMVLVFTFVALAEFDIPARFRPVVDYLAVPWHFSQDFSRGLIDTRHVVLYSSVMLFSLFLTVRSLEARRWR